MLMVFGSFAAVILTIIVVLIRTSLQIKQLKESQGHHVQQVRETYDLLANKSQLLEQQLTTASNKISQLEKTIQQQNTVLQQHQNNQQQQLDVIKELHNKVLLLEQEHQANPMYTRAKKLIELGADVDEIVKECELSRAEAELLISINKENKSA